MLLRYLFYLHIKDCYMKIFMFLSHLVSIEISLHVKCMSDSPRCEG